MNAKPAGNAPPPVCGVGDAPGMCSGVGEGSGGAGVGVDGGETDSFGVAGNAIGLVTAGVTGVAFGAVVGLAVRGAGGVLEMGDGTAVGVATDGPSFSRLLISRSATTTIAIAASIAIKDKMRSVRAYTMPSG